MTPSVVLVLPKRLPSAVLFTLVLAGIACGSTTPPSTDAGIVAGPDGDVADAEPTRDAGADVAPDVRDSAPEAAIEAGPVTCGAEKVRVVAGNLSGTGGTYDDARGVRILRGLHPDVALLQEVRYGDNSATAQRAFVDAAFGPAYAYVRGRITSSVDIPNAVVSRFPIVDSGEWIDPDVANRTFVWARIDIPGAADLYAISVHLLTTSFGDRERQARTLVDLVERLPAGAHVLLGGDFNTTSRTESTLAVLGQALVTTGAYPVDQAGNGNTNTPRSRPYDWILASSGLDPCKVPVKIGGASFAGGLVFDSRVFTPLTDVAPVELTDSDSPLQHMAVVRDFMLPQ